VQQFITQPRGRDRKPLHKSLDGLDPSLDSHYSSSSSIGEGRLRRRRTHRDVLKDFKIEALEFNGSLKP